MPRNEHSSATVSVVIPTCNRSALVQRALRSVLEQSRAADEILVVDDGSTDRTSAVLQQRFPQVRVLRQSNRGVSAARNHGIRASHGHWIAFLDSDDAWQPHKLERQLQAVSAEPDARLCHTDEIWIRDGVRVNPKRKHTKRGGWIYAACLPLCAVSPSAALVRRDVFDDIGFFDETLPACEDYDFWLRFCSRYPVVYVDETLVVKYGGHADQLSRRYWGMDRFRLRALERMLGTTHLSRQDRSRTLQTACSKATVFLNGARKRRDTEDQETTHWQARMVEWQAELERAHSGTAPAAGPIHFVVAHAAEARPLIDAYRLDRDAATGPFRVFARDDVRLIVSGTGKAAAATAAGYLYGTAGARGQHAWLNVGVAGHANLQLGSVRAAHKVVDAATGRSWFPAFTFRLPCPTTLVTTVDRPVDDYSSASLFEMEAAGFFEACTRFATLELVHSIKVVSDNCDHPFADVTPALCEQLMSESLPVIVAFANQLRALSGFQEALHRAPAEWQPFIERWHFSASQRSQLRAALRRWQVLRGEDTALQQVQAAKSAGDALRWLHDALANAHPDFVDQR